MNTKKKIFENGRPYNERGDIYYKPLERFVKFGTSGVRWLIMGAAGILAKTPAKTAYYISNGYKRVIDGREILAEDFNMPNAGMVIKSIALYNLSKGKTHKKKLSEKGLLVMYDNRPGNFEYAVESAKILAAYGIRPVLTMSDGIYTPTPLPAASRLVRERGYAGAIIFTASHNGDEWNGIKFEGEDGGAALPEVTGAIGAILAEELSLKDTNKPVAYDAAEEDLETLIKQDRARTVDTLDFYAAAVSGYLKTDAIKDAINEGRVELIYSAFFGSSGPAMVKLFRKLGLPADNIIEAQKSAGQGYVASYEPTLEKLERLTALVRARGDAVKQRGLNTIVIGGAADNDADRFQVNQYDKVTGEVDEFTPDKLSAILAHYLYKHRGFKGPVGRSFVSGSLMDEVAALFGESAIETATGFKFSPKVFVENKGIIFTEESYGISFKGWTLDKDGILPSLLALELVAVTGKGLDEYYTSVLKELSQRGLAGGLFFKRYDQALDEDVKKEAIRRFTEFFNEAGSGSFAGQKIVKKYNPVEYDGGMKFILENGSWIAFRSSGTEPLVRLYVEAHSEQERDFLKGAAFKMMGL